jgi:ribonuclease inhibitor
MAEFVIDGTSVTSRDAFWNAYVLTVQSEGAEFFGRNLDAPNDALWGGPGWPGEEFVLRISNSAALRASLGADFQDKLREVFGYHAERATLILA